MVIYGQWSYMTMHGILELMFTALREGIRIDRLLFEKSPEEQAILQENYPLTVYLKVEVKVPVFVLDIMVQVTKKIDHACLWLADTQLSYARAQCAAVEPKDFCSPVFATHFPVGLLKYPDNMVALNFFQSFLCRR